MANNGKSLADFIYVEIIKIYLFLNVVYIICMY